MKNGYVILEKGFEYDDNYYNEYENGGGTPRSIFFNRETADIKCKELNIKEFKTSNVDEYDQSLSEYGHEENTNSRSKRVIDFCQSLIKKYGPIDKDNKWDRSSMFRLHPKADDEECNKYIKIVNFSFFEIHEVPLDITDLREKSISEIINP